MTMPAVHLRDLRKGFGGGLLGGPRREVLRGASLTIEAGTLLGLTGKNGSGKTTLLKLLAGLLLPDAGELAVLGLDPRREGARLKARTGFMGADSASFYWRLTARQNLRFFAGLRGLDSAPGRAREAEVLSVAGLPEALWDQPFWTLSTGYRRRLALSRALLGRPELLLLDEPLMGLDGDGRQCLTECIEVRGRAGQTTVLVSQDSSFVVGLGGQVRTLRDGRLDEGARALGSPAPAPASILDGESR